MSTEGYTRSADITPPRMRSVRPITLHHARSRRPTRINHEHYAAAPLAVIPVSMNIFIQTVIPAWSPRGFLGSNHQTTAVYRVSHAPPVQIHWTYNRRKIFKK